MSDFSCEGCLLVRSPSKTRREVSTSCPRCFELTSLVLLIDFHLDQSYDIFLDVFGRHLPDLSLLEVRLYMIPDKFRLTLRLWRVSSESFTMKIDFLSDPDLWTLWNLTRDDYSTFSSFCRLDQECTRFQMRLRVFVFEQKNYQSRCFFWSYTQ